MAASGANVGYSLAANASVTLPAIGGENQALYATLISEKVVAIKHPQKAVSIRCGKAFITLSAKEWDRLVTFVTADEIPRATTPAKARLIKP